MQIDLATHLEKLLFLHDSVAVPALGTFSVSRTPASADYIGGAVYPPTKTLTFQENIVSDDGLLIQEIASAHGMTLQDGRRALQETVDAIQEQLGNREIVTLVGIGRLYKNYVQKIQFLPDTRNFDPDAFGLPPLQFSPISRSRPVAEEPAPTPQPAATPAAEPVASYAPPPAATSTAPPPAPPVPPSIPPAAAWTPQPDSNRAGFVRPALFAIFLFLLAAVLGFWWWKRTQEAKDLSAKKDTIAELEQVPIRRPGDEVASTTPGIEDEEEEQPAKPPATIAAPPSDAAKVQPPPAQKPETTRPAPSSSTTTKPEPEPTGSRECILIIATLREKDNADRLTAKLQDNGYQVYKLERNGFQIGVRFNYKDVKEIQETIRNLQTLTGEQDLWIKKK